MNFKAYDILSSLIPGFLLLLALLNFFDMSYDKDKVVAYTAVAFLIGYFVNAISSWLEGLYYFTWGGKPSSKLLDGKNIWKINFYESTKAKKFLEAETSVNSPSNDHLFTIAMRYSSSNTRVEDFNSSYAFARSLLTTAIVGGVFILCKHYADWKYYALIVPIIIALWLRCKQRGYYYAREVLNVYLKEKT
jgi:hypothetical protein